MGKTNDLTNEILLSLSEAARLIPSSRPGKRVAVSSIWRWCLHGVRSVRLESIVLGGSRYTSREALTRFAAACSAAAPGGEPAPVRTPTQRRRDHERACRELDAAGIK